MGDLEVWRCSDQAVDDPSIRIGNESQLLFRVGLIISSLPKSGSIGCRILGALMILVSQMFEKTVEKSRNLPLSSVADTAALVPGR